MREADGVKLLVIVSNSIGLKYNRKLGFLTVLLMRIDW